MTWWSLGWTSKDHDANFINLLNVCQEEGLVLNSKKLELWRERVAFFGAEYSAQGMHPDPKKVQGITEMTAPMDKQQLQSFLGMVNYMGTFIPNLSHHTEPLRAILKKDNVFHWEEQQTRSFQQVKTLIAKANTTPLRYYDRNLPVTVQADASLRGLGACLIQQHKGKDQPIAFASKSLTDAETRYCQHREGTSSHRLCLPTFQHLSTRKELPSRERPQTTWDDCHEEPWECTTNIFRECCWSYRDTMSPSSTNQGWKCNWPMPLAVARRELHRRSNWICK